MATTKPKAAAAYLRISRDPEELRAGVKRQEADCRAYAERKGWQLAEVYVDNDVSGWRGVPPEFERMLADIQAGRRDAVVIYNVDRLTRQPILFERFLEVCERAKVRHLGGVGGDIDLDSPDGQFMARILVAQAKKSSDDTSRRIKRALDEKAASGEWRNGGERPFGYRWSDDEGTIVPKDDEAGLVREACKRILAGESRRAITRDWHARGFLTTKGRPWSISYLARVLKSPRIAGLRVHRGEVVADGNWEALVDRETWERVGRTMRRDGSTHRGRQRRLLTGILYCGNCGEKLSAKTRRRPDGQTTRIYRCLRDTAASCGQLSVLAEPVERIVVNSAWTHIEPELPAIAAIPATIDTSEIDDRLQHLRDAQADITDARREGDLDLAEWRRQLKEISGERDALQRQRQQLLDGAPPRGTWRISTQEAIQAAGPPWSFEDADGETIDFWRDVIQMIFERVVIRGGWRGRRFSPDRIVLEPREEFMGEDVPLDPERGQGLMAERHKERVQQVVVGVGAAQDLLVAGVEEPHLPDLEPFEPVFDE